MRLAATKISYEKLHEALNLSDDIHIDDIFSNPDDRYMRTFHLVLSGLNPVIPDHQEGSQLATNPLYFFQQIQPLYNPNRWPQGQGMFGEGFYRGIKRYL